MVTKTMINLRLETTRKIIFFLNIKFKPRAQADFDSVCIWGLRSLNSGDVNPGPEFVVCVTCSVLPTLE